MIVNFEDGVILEKFDGEGKEIAKKRNPFLSIFLFFFSLSFENQKGKNIEKIKMAGICLRVYKKFVDSFL